MCLINNIDMGTQRENRESGGIERISNVYNYVTFLNNEVSFIRHQFLYVPLNAFSCTVSCKHGDVRC